nr:MAG TPA: hypothetical protein [Caudoviricetes sp.]
MNLREGIEWIFVFLQHMNFHINPSDYIFITKFVIDLHFH